MTSLAAKRGRADRVAVRLDGALAFDLAGAVVESASLRVGDILSEETSARLLAEDAPYRARDRALALLALRDRSRREVEIRLKMAGFEPAVITDAVARLQQLDYLDDRRFAAAYPAEKLRNGWGPQRIRIELLRKGVDRTLVDESLSRERDEPSGTEGMETVTALARRRFANQFRDDPTAAGRRLAGFLARRGYDWEAISAVTRTLTAEAGEGSSGESE